MNNLIINKMRKITSLVAALLLSVATFAQAPQGFSYQAVVRDAQNAIVANQTIDVTLTITAEVGGVAAQSYTETHSVTTNANGLFTLVVGQGASSQKLSDIKWNVPGAVYNLRTETAYGTATTQLMSVPFALYAEQAGELDYQKLAKTLTSDDVQAVLGYVKAAELEEYVKADSLYKYALNTSLTNNYVTKETFENYVLSGGQADAVDLTVYAKNADVEANYAKKSDVSYTINYLNDSLEYYYVKKSDIPAATDLSGYAKKEDLDNYAPLRYVSDSLRYFRSAFAEKEDVAKNYVTKEAFDNYVLSGGQADAVDLTVYAKTADVEKTYAKKADVAKYTTMSDVKDTVGYYYAKKEDLNNYAKKSDIPTVNYNIFATKRYLTDSANFLTEHQSLADYAKTADIEAGYATKNALNDKANKSEMSIVDGEAAGTAVITLQNNMSETVLTAHQSLEGYYSKAQVEALFNEFKEKLFSGKLSVNEEISSEHEYVDLGLPSRTLWATCNIGANEPLDLGEVFQYGYTDPQEGYTTSAISNYSEFFNEENYTPANGDAATANWGGNWTIPTKEQYEELLNNCYVVYKMLPTTEGLIFYKALKDADKGVYVDVSQPVELHESYQNYTDEVPHIIIPYYNGYGAGWWTSTIESEERAYALRMVIRDGVLQPILSRRTKYNGCEIRPVRNNTTPATVSDIANYYTKAESDDRYMLKTDAFTKTEGDNRYVLKEKVYTKSEVDAIVSEKIEFFRMQGEIEGKFSVSATKKVAFSQGNLQFNKSNSTWRFADKQYTTIYRYPINTNYNKYDPYQNNWTDLFCWGTSGWSGSGIKYYDPKQLVYDNYDVWPTYMQTGPSFEDFYINANSSQSMVDNYAKADWGVNNPITNGENIAGVWRTLTSDEWLYLLNTRTDAAKKRFKVEISLPNNTPVPTNSGGDVPGILLLPDDFDITIDDPKTSVDDRLRNVIGTDNRAVVTDENLAYLEKKYGVVFLPDWNGGNGHLMKNYENNTGLMFEIDPSDFQYGMDSYSSPNSLYWTATANGRWANVFDPSKPNVAQMKLDRISRSSFWSVRLVRDLDF